MFTIGLRGHRFGFCFSAGLPVWVGPDRAPQQNIRRHIYCKRFAQSAGPLGSCQFCCSCRKHVSGQVFRNNLVEMLLESISARPRPSAQVRAAEAAASLDDIDYGSRNKVQVASSRRRPLRREDRTRAARLRALGGPIHVPGSPALPLRQEWYRRGDLRSKYHKNMIFEKSTILFGLGWF